MQKYISLIYCVRFLFLEALMKISINANRCEPSPMRKFHPYAVKAKSEGKAVRVKDLRKTF